MVSIPYSSLASGGWNSMAWLEACSSSSRQGWFLSSLLRLTTKERTDVSCTVRFSMTKPRSENRWKPTAASRVKERKKIERKKKSRGKIYFRKKTFLFESFYAVKLNMKFLFCSGTRKNFFIFSILLEAS